MKILTKPDIGTVKGNGDYWTNYWRLKNEQDTIIYNEDMSGNIETISSDTDSKIKKFNWVIIISILIIITIGYLIYRA